MGPFPSKGQRRYDKNKLRFPWQEGCWQGLEFRWLYEVKAGGRPGDGSGGGRIHENLLPGLTWLGAGSSSPSAGLFPTPVLWGPQDCSKGTDSQSPPPSSASPLLSPNWKEHGLQSRTDLGSKPRLLPPAVNPGGHTTPWSHTFPNPTFRPSGLDPDRGLTPSLDINSSWKC